MRPTPCAQTTLMEPSARAELRVWPGSTHREQRVRKEQATGETDRIQSPRSCPAPAPEPSAWGKKRPTAAAEARLRQPLPFGGEVRQPSKLSSRSQEGTEAPERQEACLHD